MTSRVAFLARIGILVAISIALGFSLIAVPNVEPLSAIAFIAGYLLGLRGGAMVGSISIALFSLFNPLGPPIPAVLAAQVFAMALAGVAGFLWRYLLGVGFKAALLAGVLGAIVTVIYSISTDLALAASIGRLTDPLPIIVSGLPFSLVHIGSNTAIFLAVGAVLPRRYPPSSLG